MIKINNYRRKVKTTIFLILLGLLISNICFAAIPRYLSTQAKVTKKDDGSALEGSYSVTFRIYDASSGGTALWTETQTVSISSGILDAVLGLSTAFPSSMTFNTDYWLSIEIGSDGEMSPRIRLTCAPYAMNADEIDDIDSSQLVRNDTNNTISGNLTVNGTLTAGDASSDSFTINAATITLANVSTIDLADSSTTSLNIESGLLNFDTTNSRIGIGTTAPESKLQVRGGDLYVGTGTFDNASANPDIYVQGNLEVDGTVYGNVSGSTSVTGTTATTFTVDSDNTSGTEPADGAGYVIEGGSGDVNILWDATNDELDINKKTHFSDDIVVSGGEIYIDNGDTLNISDGTNNLLTLADAGSTGNLTLTGNITLSNVATLDLANSSIKSLIIESGLLNFDTTNSRVGIGTTEPEEKLQIMGGDLYVGTGTFTSASANPDAYIQGNLEVDGTIYGTVSGAMTSFTAAGDTGTSQTISNGDTLTLAGGNGIDTEASATDTVTFKFDATEVGTITWGSGSAITWTFDVGATDPAIAFRSGIINIDANTLYVDASNDLVGIGTSAPSAAIEIGEGISNLADGAGDVLVSGDLEVDDQVEIDGINATGSGANILTLTGGLKAFNGSDTFRGIYLNYTNANHTGTGNSFFGIDIRSITADAQANEGAIYIGNGWDGQLVLQESNGTNYTSILTGDQSANITYTLPTAVPTADGQVLSSTTAGVMSWASRGTMSSFTAAADTSSVEITDGDTLTLIGGTGIDTAASATDTVTFNIDSTEVGTTTWGSGSAFTWTFNSATLSDPTIAFGEGSVAIDSTTFFVDTANNFVGIGLTNPSYNLHVKSTAAISGSLEIPTAADPTVDAEGEVAYDSDDENLRVYDGSANRAINTVQIVTKAIFDPDGIQATEDAVPMLAVETDWAPFGITLISVGIKTDAASTYSVNFEEWTSPIEAAPSTIETVATAANTEAEDDGTLTDSSIAVGSIIYADLPTTDIDMLTVWFTYYINTGN